MSVALMITRPQPGQPQPDRRLIPVAGEKRYWNWWEPVIEQEGYQWLPGMGVGIDIDAENLPIVLAELRQLQAAVPRYYEPGTEQYQQMTERLAAVLEELEVVDAAELISGGLDLFLG